VFIANSVDFAEEDDGIEILPHEQQLKHSLLDATQIEKVMNQQ
jgi:hypothetical protein